MLAPFFEELFFRGLVQRSLEGVLPVRARWACRRWCSGCSTSAGADGAGNVGLILATAAAGVLFGVVAVRHRRLGPGMVGHGFFNLLPVVVLLAGR